MPRYIWKKVRRIRRGIPPEPAQSGEGWHKIEDSKGTAFSPFGSKRRKFFPLPLGQHKMCDLLNQNPEWEVLGKGNIAYQDDLKEVVLLNQIQGLDFHIAVKRIREHYRLVAKQFAKRVPIGIRDSMDCDP